MKTNNSKFSFIPCFKYLMIVPIVMALAAIIIGIIAGFNYDYDYKNVSTFTVKFNTTVTETEYDLFEEEITKVVVRYDLDDHRISRIGADAQNGILVEIVNPENEHDASIEDLKLDLEENLFTNLESELDRSIYISTTDTITNIPANSCRLIWMTALAVGCVLVVAFLYSLIRYNLMAGVSVVLSVLLALVMLTSANIIFRIPLNTGFPIAYAVATLLCVIISIVINNGLKPTVNDDQYAKFSNEERVYSVVNCRFIAMILVCLAFIVLPLVIIAAFSTISTLYTIISVIVAMVISVFTSMFFASTIWSFWYNREKDKMLKRRKVREQKKLENKDKTDEKIVV